MTLTERGELMAQLLNNLQIVRFALEAIMADAKFDSEARRQVNQTRASMAQKYLRAIEQQVKELVKDPNAHLGAKE